MTSREASRYSLWARSSAIQQQHQHDECRQELTADAIIGRQFQLNTPRSSWDASRHRDAAEEDPAHADEAEQMAPVRHGG